MRTLVRVVRERRWRDLSDTFGAQIALLYAQLLVWTRPQGRLITTSDQRATEPRLTASYGGEPQRLADAVDRASRYGVFGAQCLVRALALQQMLDRHAISGSVVRIGVRRGKGSDELLAHAWVELDGRVLADRVENTVTFSTLADVRVTARRRG